jgi:GNAT superfamily N-acetyltransferase
VTVALRQAALADREFSWRVKVAAFRPYVEAVWGWDEATQRRLHDERFLRGGIRIVVEDGTDVGTLLTETAPDAVHFHQLFLLPERQGRGLGARCAAAVLAEASALGLPVRLRVLRANPRARAFWERLGFRALGSTDTHDLFERGSDPAA